MFHICYTYIAANLERRRVFFRVFNVIIMWFSLGAIEGLMFKSRIIRHTTEMEINWDKKKQPSSETLQEFILFRMAWTVFECWALCAESCDGGLDLCVTLFATSCCKKKRKNGSGLISVFFPLVFIHGVIANVQTVLWVAHSTDICIQNSLSMLCMRLRAWGWRLSFPPPCRRMWVICSSGWRRSWPPLRGSLMCSLWSLGSEYSFFFFYATKGSQQLFHICVAMLLWHVTFPWFYNPFLLSAASPLRCSHVSSCLSGWRIVALMCPCSPGRCWCSSAPSCGIAQLTSPLSESTVVVPPTPCSSSNSSS